MNGLAIIYTLVIGSIAFGVIKLAEKYNWKMKFDHNKIVYSPITASLAVMLAIGLTIGLSLDK